MPLTLKLIGLSLIDERCLYDHNELVCVWVRDFTADFRAFLLRPRLPVPRCISAVSPHSPVLVSSADMLHATKRTLQMKHTWTKSISLLLRTLNIFAIIVFLDALAVSVSSRSMPRSSAGGHFFFLASLRAEETAAPLTSSHATQPGCGPHFKPSRAQMKSSEADSFPPSSSRLLPLRSCWDWRTGQWHGGQIPI